MTMNTLTRLRFLNHNRDLFSPEKRERLYWFFREQFRFGHREILLDYLQLDYSHLIEGFLQHGVHPHSNVGFWPYQELPKTPFKFYKSFVWSEQAVISSFKLEHSHVTAIGSPWLYLLSSLGCLSKSGIESPGPQQDSREILIVPAHGSGQYFAGPNYGEMVSRVRQCIGDKSASVLLYYTEFCDPSVREAWLSHGFELECSGFAWGSEHRTIWTYNGGRPNFLLNTFNVLMRHREVICTSPTTLATYSSSLGIPTSILIDSDISLAMGLVNEGKGIDRLRTYDSKIMDLSGYLLGSGFAERNITKEKVELSLKYLGVESFQTPDRLREMLPVVTGMIPIASRSD